MLVVHLAPFQTAKLEDTPNRSFQFPAQVCPLLLLGKIWVLIVQIKASSRAFGGNSGAKFSGSKSVWHSLRGYSRVFTSSVFLLQRRNRGAQSNRACRNIIESWITPNSYLWVFPICCVSIDLYTVQASLGQVFCLYNQHCITDAGVREECRSRFPDEMKQFSWYFWGIKVAPSGMEGASW